MTAFDYPMNAHRRRHGPRGYTTYEPYRDWLRDEFSFRCVLCLNRELWWIRKGTFHIDHLRAQAQDPSGVVDYDNLLYVCVTCNSLKGELDVPDPCQVAYGVCVRVNHDGTIEPLRAEGELLIDRLRLDSPDRIRFRRRMIEDLRSWIRNHEEDRIVECMRYPDDLPDLSTKRPPSGNSRPEGIEQSCFARRQRRELPQTY